MTATTAVSEETEIEMGEEPPVEEDPLDQIPDLASIIPPPGKVVLQGVECSVKHLKAREFFMLMGIVSEGMGGAITQLSFDSNDPDEVAGVIAGALMVSIPRATQDFINFVQLIVEAKGTKQEQEAIREYLQNPEIEDLFPIVDAILENEKDNLASLVGKARAYMARWKKTVGAVRQRL